jgi:Circularly permutated YpsA SLOG family
MNDRVMNIVKRIVSGGQTGVDQAALRAAQALGLPCDGWCPPGRLCESGTIPSIFPLRETPAERSVEATEIPRSQRTEWNVRDSDATLILQPRHFVKLDPGTDWAARCAARYGKPLLVFDPGDPTAVDAVKAWLESLSIHTLNVSGPSERTVPGIGDQTYLLLFQVFCGNVRPQL